MDPKKSNAKKTAPRRPATPAERKAAAPKRTGAQKLADRTFIANARIQGWSLPKIHAELNAARKGIYRLGMSQVYEDQKSIEAEWIANLKGDMDAWKAKELASLERMENELWHSWEKSKTQRRLARVVVKGTGESAPRESSVTTEDQDGDPRYLELIIKVQDRRAKMLGLNAAIKIENGDGTPLTSTPLAPIINLFIGEPADETPTE